MGCKQSKPKGGSQGYHHPTQPVVQVVNAPQVSYRPQRPPQQRPPQKRPQQKQYQRVASDGGDTNEPPYYDPPVPSHYQKQQYKPAVPNQAQNSYDNDLQNQFVRSAAEQAGRYGASVVTKMGPNGEKYAKPIEKVVGKSTKMATKQAIKWNQEQQQQRAAQARAQKQGLGAASQGQAPAPSQAHGEETYGDWR